MAKAEAKLLENISLEVEIFLGKHGEVSACKTRLSPSLITRADIRAARVGHSLASARIITKYAACRKYMCALYRAYARHQRSAQFS